MPDLLEQSLRPNPDIRMADGPAAHPRSSAPRISTAGARRHAPVVELVGLAGAGKTSLRRALAAQDPRSRTAVRIDRRRELGVMIDAAIELLPALARTGPRADAPSWRDAVQLVRLRALRPAVARAAAGPAHLVVLDEGPVFALAKLEAYSRAAQDAGAFGGLWHDALARWRDALDVVVWLDAPDDLLVQRIRGRAKPHRLKSADTRESARHLSRYREAYASVVSRLCTAGGPRLLRIDTSVGTTAEQAARLLAELDGIEESGASNTLPTRAG